MLEEERVTKGREKGQEYNYGVAIVGVVLVGVLLGYLGQH